MTEKEQADLFCGFGAMNQEKGNYEIAVDQFEKSLKVNPNFDIAWNNLGNAKKALRQFEEALSHYEMAIKCSPNRFEFYHHKGILLMELRRFEEAKFYLTKVVELDQTNIDALFHLGTINKELKFYHEAAKNFRQCLALSAGNPPVLNNLIFCLFLSKKEQEAMELLNKQLTFPPQDISWFFILPSALKIENKNEEIPAYFLQLNQRFNTDYFDWLLGFFYQQIGEVDTAESVYLANLNKHSEDLNSLYHLAQLYFHKKVYDEALDIIKRCIELGGKQRHFYDLQMRILECSASKEVVYQQVLIMEKMFDNDPLNIWYMYGIYLKSLKKDYSEAIDIFKKVNEMQESGWGHYQIGLIHNLLSQKEAALKHLEKAFSLDRATREDARFYPELDNLRKDKDFIRILTFYEKPN